MSHLLSLRSSLLSWFQSDGSSRNFAMTAICAVLALGLIRLLPDVAMAQQINGQYLGSQFSTAFWLARLAVFFMAIIFAVWSGITAIQGDTGGWGKMIGGLLVAFVAWNPAWLPNTFFGAQFVLPNLSLTGP
jgi:hypothetical protein